MLFSPAYTTESEEITKLVETDAGKYLEDVLTKECKDEYEKRTLQFYYFILRFEDSIWASISRGDKYNFVEGIKVFDDADLERVRKIVENFDKEELPLKKTVETESITLNEEFKNLLNAKTRTAMFDANMSIKSKLERGNNIMKDLKSTKTVLALARFLGIGLERQQVILDSLGQSRAEAAIAVKAVYNLQFQEFINILTKDKFQLIKVYEIKDTLWDLLVFMGIKQQTLKNLHVIMENDRKSK